MDVRLCAACAFQEYFTSRPHCGSCEPRVCFPLCLHHHGHRVPSLQTGRAPRGGRSSPNHTDGGTAVRARGPGRLPERDKITWTWRQRPVRTGETRGERHSTHQGPEAPSGNAEADAGRAFRRAGRVGLNYRQLPGVSPLALKRLEPVKGKRDLPEGRPTASLTPRQRPGEDAPGFHHALYSGSLPAVSGES